MTEVRLNRLIKKAQEKDQKAFEKLIKYKSKNITYIALSILKNKHDAEDAAQDAIISMYKNIDKLRSAEAFDAWMYRIVFNACMKVQGKTKKQSSGDFVELADIDAVEKRAELLPYEHQVISDDRRLLLEKLHELPDNYRNCLYLFYFEDMSYQQIADTLQSTTKEVSNWLDRGRKKLRTELVSDDISRTKKDAPGVLEGALLAGAFAEDMQSTVPNQEIFNEAWAKAKEYIEFASAGLLSSTAAKLVLGAAVVVIAAGVGLCFFWGDPLRFMQFPVTADLNVPAKDLEEGDFEGNMQEAGGTGGETASRDASGSGSETTDDQDGAAGGGSANRENLDITIDNVVLYGPADPDDPDNPNTPHDPAEESNRVETNVQIENEGSRSQSRPQTGDAIAIIVAVALLVAALAALIVFLSKRRSRGN